MVVFVKGALPNRPNPNSLEGFVAFDVARSADKLGLHDGRIANSTESAVMLQKPLPGARFRKETLQTEVRLFFSHFQQQDN